MEMYFGSTDVKSIYTGELTEFDSDGKPTGSKLQLNSSSNVDN